jgi:hypothetical protein
VKKIQKKDLPRVVGFSIAGLIVLTLLILTIRSDGGGFAQLFPQEEGVGFPYDAGTAALRLLPQARGVEILSADGVTLLDKKGEELYTRRLDYTDLIAASAEGRTLVANRVDGRYFLHNAKKKLFEGTLTRPVTSVAVSRKQAALVSQTAAGLSRVEVLDEDGAVVFTWETREGRIVSAALSPNDKLLCIALLRVSEGERSGSVHTFNLKKNTEQSTWELPLDTPLRVGFTAQNRPYFLTDHALQWANQNEALEGVAFNTDTLERFAFAPGGQAALILRGADGAQRLVVYSSKGALAWEKPCGAADGLATDGEHTVLLAEKTLTLYDKVGQVLGMADAGEALDTLCVSGKTVYGLTVSGVVVSFVF